MVQYSFIWCRTAILPKLRKFNSRFTKKRKDLPYVRVVGLSLRLTFRLGLRLGLGLGVGLGPGLGAGLILDFIITPRPD